MSSPSTVSIPSSGYPPSLVYTTTSQPVYPDKLTMFNKMKTSCTKSYSKHTIL